MLAAAPTQTMKPAITLIVSIASVFATGTTLLAQKEEGWNPDTKFPPLPPAEGKVIAPPKMPPIAEPEK